MPTSIDPPPGENEIECARCGAVFHYELTRCPNCGVNIYEPENDEQQHPGLAGKPGPVGRMTRFFRRLFGEPHPADELFQSALDQAALYNDLVRKTGGDPAAADRLIDFERGQTPQQTRAQWIQNAIQRWERDNRFPR